MHYTYRVKVTWFFKLLYNIFVLRNDGVNGLAVLGIKGNDLNIAVVANFGFCGQVRGTTAYGDQYKYYVFFYVATNPNQTTINCNLSTREGCNSVGTIFKLKYAGMTTDGPPRDCRHRFRYKYYFDFSCCFIPFV